MGTDLGNTCEAQTETSVLQGGCGRVGCLRLLVVMAASVSQLQAVIVDRVAVAVGNKVITQSEIEQRIRLTAFEKQETPDFSLASRRQAAQRLIDQRLVEQEMDVGHFPRASTEDRQ